MSKAIFEAIAHGIKSKSSDESIWTEILRGWLATSSIWELNHFFGKVDLQHITIPTIIWQTLLGHQKLNDSEKIQIFSRIEKHFIEEKISIDTYRQLTSQFGKQLTTTKNINTLKTFSNNPWLAWAIIANKKTKSKTAIKLIEATEKAYLEKEISFIEISRLIEEGYERHSGPIIDLLLKHNELATGILSNCRILKIKKKYLQPLWDKYQRKSYLQETICFYKNASSSMLEKSWSLKLEQRAYEYLLHPACTLDLAKKIWDHINKDRFFMYQSEAIMNKLKKNNPLAMTIAQGILDRSLTYSEFLIRFRKRFISILGETIEQRLDSYIAAATLIGNPDFIEAE